jgi:diguanylate cyclase (GGDEF)-like protein
LTAVQVASLLPPDALDRAAELVALALGCPVAPLRPGEPITPPIRVAVLPSFGMAGVLTSNDLAWQNTPDAQRAPTIIGDGVRAYIALSLGAPAQGSGEASSEQRASLCVLSDAPREWTEREIDALRHIADTVGAELDLRARLAVVARAADQLKETALRDPLTGLPNRALFVDRLSHAIERARRHKDFLFAVLSVNVDRFDGVVDGLGHEAADDVLVTIARRFESWLRDDDTVTRVSRDEFLVLLESIRGEHDAIRVAARLQDSIRQPIATVGGEVYVSASVGIALGMGELEPAPRMLQQAGIARSRAKAMGTDRHAIFDRQMHDRADARLRLETDLRQAVDKGSFEIYYQPMISLESGRVTELEALIRWRHPTRGLVAPLEFIPLAEETGLIVPIGAWVLANACPQVREWQHRFAHDEEVALSVNVSARQLQEANFVDTVSAVLAATQLSPSSLKLEVTETMIIDEPERARRVLDGLRALGVGIYLDDFGTGYSSLGYVHQLPIDALKIDHTFVRAMDKTATAHQLVRIVADLAKSLDVPSIAEGVENTEQLAMVRALGCDAAQGYLFSRPEPAAKVEELLAANTQW